MGDDKDNGKQGYEKHPFLLSVDEVGQILKTNTETGLPDVDVVKRQEEYGPNRLHGDGGPRWYALLGKQISNAMILIGVWRATENVVRQSTGE
ncbi:conserved hypothetical protein [Histoplasma capsulatum var. duboisii H88]|uniref:Cation-transporting P-type ATPase N-terminal domain-containing protein n=1 Tax=Ajellomyces capsulatus (strain H88) TaxID=544711 RepID=F0U5H1_AJEC8|nr:conserved hypothetical protein [Histoplasma capsulatum var. duboisii H88]